MQISLFCNILVYHCIISTVNLKKEIMEIFFIGIYLFTVSYKTRTCGALSLCAPTVVQLVKNVDAVQTFSRSLSDNANTDMDMVLINWHCKSSHTWIMFSFQL